MDNSILKKIKEWGKQNDFPFSCIIYKIDSNFPKAFIDTLKNYINPTNPDYHEIDNLKDFAIVFDKDKNVYFEFIIGVNTRIHILEDDIFYDNLNPSIKIKEEKFIKDIKYKDSCYLFNQLQTLPSDVRKRIRLKNLDEIMNKITNNIIDYADYCMEERKKLIEKLYFTESDSAKNSTRNTDKTKNYIKKDAESIPFEEREKVLNRYSAAYEFEAQSNNTDSSYIIKIYNIKNQKYKIVMEPKEANKYTKIVHINKEKLSLGEAKEIVINSLQLNRDQITQTKNITRHSHKTIEGYRKLLEYVIEKNNLGINKTSKKHIDEAEEHKKR